MPGKHRFVPEVSMLSEEVDYAALHKMSVPRTMSEMVAESRLSDMDKMFEKGWTPGKSEMVLMRELSNDSVLAGFIPSVLSCMACDEKPAQSRDESVVVLCEECAARLMNAVMAEMSEKSFDTPYARHQAVYAYMLEKFGYEMVDAELAKMSEEL